MVKTVGRSFVRKKNYGLTVTVSSKPWWAGGINFVTGVVVLLEKLREGRYAEETATPLYLEDPQVTQPTPD
jgi:hypothetical protein